MFDRDIFKALIGEIADTREVEIGCDECFEQLDRFVEMKLSGLNAAQAMPLVQEHVEICGECREEFEALLAALRRPEKFDRRAVSVEHGWFLPTAPRRPHGQ